MMVPSGASHVASLAADSDRLAQRADRRDTPDGHCIVIVCATNEAYIHAAAAMLHSVAVHVPPLTRLQIYVLEDELSLTSKSRLQHVIKRFPVAAELLWRHPCDSRIAQLRSPAEWPSRAIYLRLLIGSTMPEELQRVVYLDTDLIVCADISELWSTPLRNHPVAAVQNHIPSVFGEHRRLDFQSLGIDFAEPYFNSGVLVIDLPAWRRAEIEERTLHFLGNRCSELLYPDQDALNIALVRNWTPLPHQWNVLSAVYMGDGPDSAPQRTGLAKPPEMVMRPKAVHYAGNPKPWLEQCCHPARELFRRHLHESGWSAT